MEHAWCPSNLGPLLVTTAARGLLATDKNLKTNLYKLMGPLAWLAYKGVKEVDQLRIQEKHGGIRLSRCFSAEKKELGQHFVPRPIR